MAPMARCKPRLIALTLSTTILSIPTNPTNPPLFITERYPDTSMALKSTSTFTCLTKDGMADSFNSFSPHRIPRPRPRQLASELRVVDILCMLLTLEVIDRMLQLPKFPGMLPGASTESHHARSTGISTEAAEDLSRLSERWKICSLFGMVRFP